MHVILQNLVKLQALEFSDVTVKNAQALAAELREQIPAAILGHYDRLRARGKKGVAVVRNQACTGCHMRQPLGKITILMRSQDLQLCDSCGRYLCLPDPAESQTPEPAPTKTVAKGRKRKVLANVA